MEKYEEMNIRNRTVAENDIRCLKAVLIEPLTKILKRFDGKQVLRKDGMIIKKLHDMLSAELNRIVDSFEPTKINDYFVRKKVYLDNSRYSIIVSFLIHYGVGEDKSFLYDSSLTLCSLDYEKRIEKYCGNIDVKPFDVDEILRKFNIARELKSKLEDAKNDIDIDYVRSMV